MRNTGENILQKVKQPSKIGQDLKTLIYAFLLQSLLLLKLLYVKFVVVMSNPTFNWIVCSYMSYTGFRVNLHSVVA